jgi:hypothetical protein
VQRPWADQIGSQIGVRQLQETLTTIRRLIATLEAEAAAQDT